MKKFLSLLLVCLMVVPFGVLATTGISAAGEVWDGKTGDLGWYLKDTAAAEFEIKNGEELYGLSILLAHEPKASIKGDGKIYYDDNNKIILDAEKITDTTKSTARTQLNGKTVKLTADIDLGNHPFLPIGSTGSIKANFDGQNHTVKNLYVNAETAKHRAQSKQFYYGLFAYIAINVEVRNVKVDHAVFDIDIPEADALNPYIYCGGLVGAIHHNDASHIKDCSVNDLTINFKPHESYTPLIEASSGNNTMIGAALGRLANGVAQENITVTNYQFNDLTENPENYVFDESMFFGATGGVTAMPHCPGSSVTLKDGTKLTAPTLDLGDEEPDEPATPSDTKKPATTSKPATTDKATQKADATTAAPSTDAPQNNTTLIIIIAGVAAAIVIAVVVIVVIKKKSAK